GGNINGEKYDPELGAMLRRTLLEPVGQWCVFWWPHPRMGHAARTGALEWIEKHRPNVRWIPDRPIGRANQEGKAAPFWLACRTRFLIVVGLQLLGPLDMFPVAVRIVVPVGTAWYGVDHICGDVRAQIRAYDLVFFSAGMASNQM